MDNLTQTSIIIREANQDDCKFIFDWRNNKLSKKMSFNNRQISYQDHLFWFSESLKNPNRILYVCEISGSRAGVCKFDYDFKINNADISININPKMRDIGIGKRFLSLAIDKYSELKETNLSARIKKNNFPSKKIFLYAGFKILKEENEVIYLKRSINDLAYRIVEEKDWISLYDLLKKRVHNISHSDLPTKEIHKEFVKNNPYAYWFLIYESKKLIGTFYIKNDNSIGLNLLYPQKEIVKQILNHIKSTFLPKKEVKSMVPPYFFLNIPPSNKIMLDIIKDFEYKLIQSSFRI